MNNFSGPIMSNDNMLSEAQAHSGRAVQQRVATHCANVTSIEDRTACLLSAELCCTQTDFVCMLSLLTLLSFLVPTGSLNRTHSPASKATAAVKVKSTLKSNVLLSPSSRCMYNSMFELVQPASSCAKATCLQKSTFVCL